MEPKYDHFVVFDVAQETTAHPFMYASRSDLINIIPEDILDRYLSMTDRKRHHITDKAHYCLFGQFEAG